MKKTIMCVFLHTFSSYFTLFSSEWCDLHWIYNVIMLRSSNTGFSESLTSTQFSHTADKRWLNAVMEIYCGLILHLVARPDFQD